jgi:HD-GYP domain-containing protein (c-di-GMP phosphodiesterase class II)
MSLPDTVQLKAMADSELSEDVANVAARVGGPVLQLIGAFETELAHLMAGDCVSLAGMTSHERHLAACVQAARAITYDGEAIAVALGPELAMAFCGMRTDSYSTKLAAVITAPERIARALMQSACEATRLNRQSELLQVQLDASALQIAQSFEEQCWLRDLARNMSISNATANANVLAQGILAPLVDLLRAEELFLLVHEEETGRSGLASGSFGQGRISPAETGTLLQSLVQKKPSGPIVINNDSLMSGRVHSLVAVPLLSRDRPLGYIVALNRIQHKTGRGLNLMDPEFGSVESGLLEEASILLSTQTHNIRLILDSQHLALGTLQAMSRAIDARDPYTRGHSERVARLSFEIGEILGLEETACQEIYVAGILHDVGKIGVPDRVLLKAGALSDEEFNIIKQHPEIGYRIIEQLGKLHFTLPGVLYHHEHWDGQGYPQGLAGDNIPLMARIIAVADSFDAMTSSRPYRHAMPLAKACEIMDEGSGKQWDAMLVRCFQQWQKQRRSSLQELPPEGISMIPQEPPYADITQSILAMQM